MKNIVLISLIASSYCNSFAKSDANADEINSSQTNSQSSFLDIGQSQLHKAKTAKPLLAPPPPPALMPPAPPAPEPEPAPVPLPSPAPEPTQTQDLALQDQASEQELPPSPAPTQEDKAPKQHKAPRSLGARVKGKHIATYSDPEFLASEIRILNSPDDEVIDGKLTYQAWLDTISYDQYIQEFERCFISNKQKKQADEIQEYLDNYEQFFLKK